MGKGNLQRRCGGRCGGDARHDLDRNARRPQRLDFLAAAPEHEGIATLQPHDSLPLARESDHQGIDLRLRLGMPSASFTDTNEHSLAARMLEDAIADKIIVQYDVSRFQRANG